MDAPPFGAAVAEWVKKLLHDLRHGQEAQVVKRLEQLLENPAQRPAEVQKVLEGEVNYSGTTATSSAMTACPTAITWSS